MTETEEKAVQDDGAAADIDSCAYRETWRRTKKNAEAGHYPPDGTMEWHATVFDWLKYMREPRDRFGRRFGVNIFSYYWGDAEVSLLSRRP